MPSVILHAFSTFGVGGPQLRIAKIINTIDTEWKHAILSMDSNFKAADLINDRRKFELVYPPKKHSVFPHVCTLLYLLRRIRPDLVITYNWGAIEVLAAATLGLVCPVIHHEHGFGPDEAVRRKDRRILARRALLNHIHCTIVPSQTLRRIALDEYKVTPEKVRFIPNGVDIQKFEPRRNPDLRASLGANTSDFVVGTVAALRPEKNLDLLIRAFADARINNGLLVIVGDGPCREDLVALVRDLQLQKRVTFVGAVTDSSPYYGCFDLFAMSSVTEQMPMSLLEAMASGLSAVCTDVGDCAELVGGAAFPSIVESYNKAELTRALIEMASSPDLRYRKGQENRRRAVEQYSAAAMIQNYRREIEGALRHRR